MIRAGREFLASFPNAPQRTPVALLMADAYARTRNTQEEFAIYDSVLRELALKAQKIPLGGAGDSLQRPAEYWSEAAQESTDGEGAGQFSNAEEASSLRNANQAFQVGTASTSSQFGARSPEYSRVLERYLARRVQLKQVPAALAVLRREIDRNPNDPGLYERLAVFLDQNRLGAEQEEIYRRAMARFPERSWYDRLARFYLRYKRDADFETLTQEAVRTFSGTDLEQYFGHVGYGGTPALYLRLNQYANQRFPHNPVFVRNLLNAYHDSHTYDDAAWQQLLRQHWFEEADLRNEFFEYLSAKGMLESELSSLRPSVSAVGQSQWDERVRANPAAGEFIAQGELWQSHFEQAAPVLRSLAEQYPAASETAHTASAVYRSLAYFEAVDTGIAAKIEENLLQANPGNREIMSRIGDIYADRELFAKAAPYWDRIPQTAPGQSGGYLEAASIYWDYFDFENALRLLNQGRKKLVDENLYCYEAGAIYENQRDYTRAIGEYVKGSLAGGANSPADVRLMELARRPKLRDQIDQQTLKLVTGPSPSMEAVNLRVRVLEAENRRLELETFLDSSVNRTTSIEQVEEIEVLAEQKSLELVREHALEKQSVLTTDPVNRLQLRYRLVQLYESRKDFQSAQRNVEALYRENPKILGVVRSTVDFYWRTKNYSPAIAVLLQASKDAYPELSKQFVFEAARKSTDAGLYAQAQDLLAGLLKTSPYDGQYLAAMAETYAQAGDDRGLRQFYLDKISLFRSAPFSADERKTRIATLRRGLILALTRMKDYAGATDQYIELINSFPEDAGLVSEAALYGLRYQRQPQMLDFYSKTVAQAPRDYRWPMVLAQIQTSLEQYPAAIESYGKAVAVRPDRVDLRAARAGLEERLMRFDEAAADYERVYQLAFKDPKWMEKVAEIRARQGHADDAVAALKIALIDAGPENAAKYFEVAGRLESWGMLTQARGFAEQGVSAAGADLLTTADLQSGARAYARIMTRLRQHEKAFAVLQRALDEASSVLPVLKEQLARQGIAAITDKEWRDRAHENRVRIARDGLRSALNEMGSAVSSYFVPEEKVAFTKFAEGKCSGMSLADVDAFAVPLAQSAGLGELEARWRYELMMDKSANSNLLLSRMQPFVDLQRRRLKFAELGAQLEQFAPRIDPQQRYSVWVAAQDAYQAAGDPEGELRAFAGMPFGSGGREQQTRLFQLLLTRQPNELVKRASFWTSVGQDAADYLVANGSPELAHSLVSLRGRTRTPVWSKSYDALVGLYLAEQTPAVNAAFLSVLGDNTVSERLASPVDRTQQLAGNIWFYYGSRYGEYSGLTRQGNPEDFLPALLEQSPGSASGYLTVADYYVDNGDTARAIADYEHTLELAPGRADVHDRLALAYFKQGARAEAIAQWKQVFSTLGQKVNSMRLPESFWADFSRSCENLRSRELFNDLKPDVDALLRAYLHRNGNYRSNALLHSAYAASADPAVNWLLDLASAADDSTTVLADVADASWIPPAQRAPIYQRILQAKQDAVSKSEGLQKEGAQQALRSWQVRWIRYLVATTQYAPAADAIAALSKETRIAEAAAIVPLELQVAAQTGTIDSKMDGYRADPQAAPAADVLRMAARQLSDSGDKQSARKVLEFVFARELEDHKLEAANFLGLAEIRIAAGDTPGAVELLRRLAAAVGNPFENLDPAAALLEKTGHNAEAIEFLEQLARSAPWESTYRLRLARARVAAARDVDAAQNSLTAIASSAEVNYSVRTQAALALAGNRPLAESGSVELNLLSSGDSGITASAADQPFFYDARLRAASSTGDARTKVQLLGNALADTPTRDDARIPLFQAAAGMHSDEFARGVIRPLLRRQFLSSIPRPVSGQEEMMVEANNDAADQIPPSRMDDPFKLPTAQQARVATTLDELMIRLNRLDEALRYLQVARQLEKTPARRKEISGMITEVTAGLRRQRLNAARQPILHEALEQDRLVRPKLLARAARPVKTPVKGATSQ